MSFGCVATEYNADKYIFAFSGVGKYTITELPFSSDLDTHHVFNDILWDEITIPNLTVYDETDIYYKYSADFNIESQRGDVSIGLEDGYLWYSADNSLTFDRGARFFDADGIGLCYIFANGNILFGTRNKLYLSTDNMQSYSEKIVVDAAGNPANVSNPGGYFYHIVPDNPVIIDGFEHLVFGNYTNLLANSEVYIYHTYDNGETITVVYEFGQNPDYDSYGDASNPLVTRHVHAISYNAAENIFWIQTGDGTDIAILECHWLKGVWNGSEWIFTVEETGQNWSYYKTVGFYFDGSDVYWGSDSAQYGVWKVAWDDIGDSSKYVNMLGGAVLYGGFIMNDEGEGIACPFQFNTLPTNFVFTKDKWETSTVIGEDIMTHGPTDSALYRIWPKNNEGYFLMKVHFGLSFQWGSKKSLMVKLK